MCEAHLNEDKFTNYLWLGCSYVTTVFQEWLCLFFTFFFPTKEAGILAAAHGVQAAGLE